MPAEISIRQLHGLASVLADDGVDFADFVGGMDLDFEDIFARLDWQDYAAVLERVHSRCSSKALRKFGAATLYTEDAYLFRANILLGYDRPLDALVSMCAPGGVFQTIVPCIDVECEVTGPRSCLVKTWMQAGYPPCRAHHEVSAGAIADFPRILFEKPASVVLLPTDSGVDYDVRFVPGSPLGVLRRRWVRSKRNRTFLKAVADVFMELSDRQVTAQRESELRVESEEKLRRAEKMEALGQLTGGVAHDFNNLLLVVQGNLDLLRNRLTDHDSQLLFQAADDAVQRGADLTKQLLAFGRKSPLRPQTLNLNVVVREMETLLRRTLGEQIAIEAQRCEDPWSTNVDRGLLQNAIVNLALNARDAMPDGGRLTISTENKVMEDDHPAGDESSSGLVPGARYVKLSLCDTGTGMSEEVAARAFDPFFTTKPIGEGSGLGLTMVYGFLQQSNGTVQLKSELGTGTCISLLLPEAREVLKERPLEIRATPTRGRGELVLVVEDDEDVCQTVVMQLRQLGYRTLMAQSGNSAMRILDERDDVDVILTDIVLPGGMSGIDLAVQALQSGRTPGVVYMSGYPDRAFKGTAGMPQHGICLAKPFQREDLAHAIEQALD